MIVFLGLAEFWTPDLLFYCEKECTVFISSHIFSEPPSTFISYIYFPSSLVLVFDISFFCLINPLVNLKIHNRTH